MIASLSLQNMFAWLVQVSMIAALGALLPTLLRIRHPKSQLAYYHAILLLCLAVPFIQPVQHPLVVVSNSWVGSRAAAPGISWAGLVLGLAALGIAAKLLWLGVGLWQLRRLRKSALPIYSIPQSIREARTFTGTDAVFCISKDVAGPATLGFFEPVVLLPASFLSLDEDAQRSVACHELMHVRRNDWLVTLLEEVAGSLLWFHPLVWFLLAKTRLTREQVVDAEVVRMNAPGPYIDALLSMAVVSKPRLALPAAPFFTEGHLTYRMRLLLASPRRSLTRLCISYACTAGVLAFAGWSVLILFPLNGDAHVVSAAAHRLPTYQVASSGRRLLLPASSTFNLKLPAPAGETKDLVYFVNTEGQQAASVQGYLMLPPPPPPPPPGPPAVFRTGLRVLRPGQVATPAEIQNFIASFPQQTLVQVIKGEDGTIQRVMVTRRSADATIFTPFGVGVLGGIDGPATAAGTTDRVH